MRADDRQAVVAANEHEAGVLIPAPAQTTAALPEDTAWNMIYAEGGAMAVCFAIALVVLWRVISRVLEELRSQAKELILAQGQALQALKDAVSKVETAVKLSDVNNQNSIGRLSDTVTSAIARIDRAEIKLESTTTHLLEHSHRIQALETGSHRILPAVPGQPR